MVTIMIADDHALIRRVVRELVEKESDMEIVAEACDGHEAETQAIQTQPDVVLMDLDMPVCDGFEATERILACSPHSCVVILTASHYEQDVFQAIQHGAVGYLTKDIKPEALIHAIRCASLGGLCIPPPMATCVLARIRSLRLPASIMPVNRKITLIDRHTVLSTKEPEQSQHATISHLLTEREREILDLIRMGHKNREIARELCVAESTVHKHVQNILEKLHARNRTEAIYLTHESVAI